MLRAPLLALALCGLTAGAALAQERAYPEARFEPATAAPGQAVELVVEVAIDPGFHLYGALNTDNPTTLVVGEDGGLVETGPAEVPPGTLHDTFGIQSYWIEEEFTIRQPFQVPADAAAGTIDMSGLLAYMACTPEYCDPPAQAAWSASLTVDPNAAPPAEPEPAADPAAEPVQFDFGQDPFNLFGGEKKLELEARVEPATARPGERVTVTLEATVVDGWHVYGAKDENPAQLKWSVQGGLEEAGPQALPDGERHEPIEGYVNYWLSGKFEVSRQLTVPEDAAAGTVEIGGALHYMPCDDSSCLDPTQEPFVLELAIEAGPVRPEFAADAEQGGAGGSEARAGAAPEEDEEIDLWGLILASIAGGIFALLMPCTYPMIPITISFFTKQAIDRGGNVLGMALSYGFGIVLMFIGIGLLVGPLIVTFAAHWLTNLVFAALFIVFALSLFGVFTLQPPRFLMDASGKASTKGGLLGVFLMGLTLVISSFTCSAPIIGTLLVFSADEGRTLEIFVGMAVFGLTMATPFVFLSLVPARLQRMPKAGAWMNTLKIFLGFVEIAAAFKFLSNAEYVHQLGALPRELFLLLWAVIFGVAGLYLLGRVQLKDYAEDGIGPGRMTSGLATLLFAAYCFYGSMGNPLDSIMTAIAPPYSNKPQAMAGEGGDGATRSASTRSHTIIKDDHEAALARARKEDKLVLINFTGFT